MNRTILVSGADLVNGTPIVDLKPWGPFDCPTCIHNTVDHSGIVFCGGNETRCLDFQARVPDWVNAGLRDPYKLPVTWAPIAITQLEDLVKAGSCSFYQVAEFEKIKLAITQMLSLDIRSVHRGHGAGPEVQSVRNPSLATDLVGDQAIAQQDYSSGQAYEAEFDNVHIQFYVRLLENARPFVYIENITARLQSEL
jgi:hypothetical protein